MKKRVIFLIGTTILIFIFGYLSLITYAHLGMMKYMNIEYPTYEATKNLSKSKIDAEIVLLGDSRCKAAFIPSEFNDFNVVNLAIGGATIIDSYYTLKNYFQQNKPPKAVVLSFAPFHWKSVGTLRDRAIKFDYHSLNDQLDIFRKGRLSPELFSEEERKYSRFAILKYKTDLSNYWSEIANGTKEKRRKYLKNVYLEVVSSKGHFFYGRRNSVHEAFPDHAESDFFASKVHLLYLEKIKELCGDKTKILYTETPINQATNTPNRLAYSEDLETSLSKLGITTLNSLWVEPDAYFGDPSHIYSGASHCSRQLNDQLKMQLKPQSL